MALPENPINRYESYLAKIAGQEVEVPDHPITREEAYLDYIAKHSGGGGTTDYEELTHKPSINNVELSGDKSLSDLGAASEGAVAAKASQSDIAPTFSDATAYTAGDVVYYEGSLYRFTANHSAGAWDSADVESVTVDDLVDGLKPVDNIIDGDLRAVTSNAVYDALALKADSPVDSVTDGDMRPVTSNAVADAMGRLDWSNKETITTSSYTPTRPGQLILHGSGTGADALITIQDSTAGLVVATASHGVGTGLGCNTLVAVNHQYTFGSYNAKISNKIFVPFG